MILETAIGAILVTVVYWTGYRQGKARGRVEGYEHGTHHGLAIGAQITAHKLASLGPVGRMVAEEIAGNIKAELAEKGPAN